MKVLMFGWEFPPHISGGLGTASYGLTKGMSKIPGMMISFVVPKAYGDEDTSRMRILGANEIVLDKKLMNYETFLRDIEYVEINSKIVPYTDPEDYLKLEMQRIKDKKPFVYTNFSGAFTFSGGYGGNLYQQIADYAVVASELALSDEFDIIHAHDWLTFPAGIAAKRVSGKPLVIHVHATDFDRSGGSVNPSVFDIELKGMRNADRIIAVSHLTRNTIIEKYGIEPEKVVTVHNAVEPVQETEKIQLQRNLDDKIVTFLGRVTLQKGPEYFIEAAYKVLQKMDNVRFVMAGSGELLNRMIIRVASLRIANKFHFTGFLKGDDVYRMFSLSDVYVMPSVSEPFGISPLEAMQSNVPVIISHQSGVSEVLKYAIKVDFWDIDAMADAIYGLLNYNALSDMFKTYGREEVENMKWENSAKQVNEVYQSVLNK
jgi:glycosyltransferase involved in cell wall biosynthesis